MIIFRTVEWDMGHRITNHKSLCRNLHGHRYKAEIGLSGDLINKAGISEEGMVLDFGSLKEIIKKDVEEYLDHGFMIWDQDKILMNFFKTNKDLKSIPVPFPPTAENIATLIFDILSKVILTKYKNRLKVSQVKLWETPNNFVLYEGENT